MKKFIFQLAKVINLNMLRNLSIAVLLLLSMFLLAKTHLPQKENSNQETIDYAIDGDTIRLANGERVRLIGIDSPEKGECFYEESRKAAQELLNNKTIILEQDISAKDDYGRFLRYVLLPAESENEDRVLVNEYLVRQGYAKAVASAPDNRYRDLLISAQEEALRENRGLWAKCEYEDELEGRREPNDAPPSEEYIIKGNISTRGFGKTYLIPGCDNYNLVKIDLSKGEQYFKTEQDAIEAGFRKATNCP